MDAERWDKAIAHAKAVQQEYKAQPDISIYSWVIDSIDAYVYLAEVWQHQGIAVLEWLEEVTFDTKKWRNRRLVGPKRGKAGHAVAEEDL